jgi:hypothetical protein
MVISAALAEGLKPSHENLPASGELVRRERVDEMTGAKSIGWMGRESFIKQMSRGGQHVLRICDPRRGLVLMGAPFDRTS